MYSHYQLCLEGNSTSTLALVVMILYYKVYLANDRKGHTQGQPTHIALQFIGFLGLNHIILVRHASPLVQVIAVINVADQGLALFRMQDGKHVHRALELGLPFGPVHLVLSLVLKLASYEGPPDPVVIPGCEGAHVVSFLLLVVQLVFILNMRKQNRGITACLLDTLQASDQPAERL